MIDLSEEPLADGDTIGIEGEITATGLIVACCLTAGRLRRVDPTVLRRAVRHGGMRRGRRVAGWRPW